MKKLKLLWRILRTVDGDKIFIGFLSFTFIVAFGIQFVEPGINTYSDALWYAFTVITTIGFGDFTAVTLVGRLLTVILSLYGILVVALIPGIVVSYFMEFRKTNAKDSVQQFMEKLENLDKLSEGELKELSKKIKDRKYKL